MTHHSDLDPDRFHWLMARVTIGWVIIALMLLIWSGAVMARDAITNPETQLAIVVAIGSFVAAFVLGHVTIHIMSRRQS